MTYDVRNAEASVKVFPLSRHFCKGLALLYPATYGNTSGYFACSHARCLLCLFVAGQVVDFFFLPFPCWKPAAEAGNDTNENR